ncbi:MAG: aminoacyl-tRNA hydrolase [Myxococcota bacterium]
MFLVVGLGNPGDRYADTRHNVGFWVVDRLAEAAGAHSFEKKFKARVARVRIGTQDVFLMKPETFMNLSGESVGPAVGFFKVPVNQVVVVHDDLDLDVGRVKLKKGGGHGGHNGLRSLIQHLPASDFLRVRLGIGRPPPRWEATDYVLGRFSGEDAELAAQAVEDAAEAVKQIVSEGIGRAMNRFNRNEERSGEEPAGGPAKRSVR